MSDAEFEETHPSPMSSRRMAVVGRIVAMLGALMLLAALAPACNQAADDDDNDDDDDDSAVADDDDDDDTGTGDDDDDDDFTFEDPPVFLASYDFSLVFLENELTGDYGAVHGQMAISVSTTAFLAEMVTDSGLEWDWGGTLEQNEQAFLVRGWMLPPGLTKEIFVEVNGNFLGGATGDASDSCLTGIGQDDDPNLPDQGIEFAWYGCQTDAPPAAIDRSGSHPVTVTVHGDNCAGWPAINWTEVWSFEGRMLTVSRGGYEGYGIVSDDGNVFRFSMAEQVQPGRSLKVVGDFTNPTGTTEARATGFCHGVADPGSVIDLDY